MIHRHQPKAKWVFDDNQNLRQEFADDVDTRSNGGLSIQSGDLNNDRPEGINEGDIMSMDHSFDSRVQKQFEIAEKEIADLQNQALGLVEV